LKKNSKIGIVVAFVFAITSCDYFKTTGQLNAVVSLNDHHITREDLQELLPDFYTPQDSVRIAQEYIDSWVTDQLLMANAKNNLKESEQENLDKLIKSYRTQLYTQAYKEQLIKQNLDTLIPQEDILNYFDKRKEEFRINEDLVQVRYVQLNATYENIDEVKRLFKKNDSASAYVLDSLSLGFKSYFLNDSIWVKKSNLLQRIPALTPSNEKSYIKDKAYFELEDSVSLYLVRFRDVKRRGERAPLSYVTPTIKQILLNKRKVSFIKELEKDLLDDAIKSKKVQIKS
jgi:hypothetical protein